jgi:hypothetical protein
LRAKRLAILVGIAAILAAWWTGFGVGPSPASPPPTLDEAWRHTAVGVIPMPVIIPRGMSGKVM